MGSYADGAPVTLGEADRRAGLAATLPAATALGALAVLYAPVLAGMASEWWSNPANSHGFLVAPIAAYLAWQRRAEIKMLARPSWWGMPLLAVCLLLYPAGVFTQVEFLPKVSFALALGAVMLLFLGRAGCRELAFPYAFLWFMVPWPDTLVEWVSFPMQLFSAKFAAMLAGLGGMGVTRDGVDIHMSRYTFSVGVPCSGMKSLVSLLALSALLAYLLHGPIWKRWALFIAGFPLALLANVVRIVVILVIAKAMGSKAAEGFLHGFSGVLVFAVATAGLLATGRAMGLERPTSAPSSARLDAATAIPETGSGGSWRRALPAFVLLALTYGLVRLAAVGPVTPGSISADFSALPASVGGWRMTQSAPLDRTSQEMLHPDAYVGRVYTRTDGYPVNVTVVFGHAKETFHSPGFCLLGGGWNITRKDRCTLDAGAGAAIIQANRFSLQRGDERRLVLYWYASAGETTPSWVAFQYRLLRNRLTGRSASGALVRFVAPVLDSEGFASKATDELVRGIYPDLRKCMSL